MKTTTCLMLLFCLVSTGLHAQINQFSEDKILAEKERRQVQKSKIKETRIYLHHYHDTLLGPDSMLISKYQYDKQGGLLLHVEYLLSQYGYKFPPNEHTYTNTFDDKEHLVQQDRYVLSYSTFNGKRIPYKGDQWSVSYTYNASNMLVEDDDGIDYIARQQGDIGKQRQGNGKTIYSYDTQGNLVTKDSRELFGTIIFRNEYTYSSKNELLQVVTYIDSTETPFLHHQYQYVYNDAGLVKTETVYNKLKQITAQREFVYDKQSNQLKGYDVVNGVKRLVWDHHYNKRNEVTESMGGPATRFGPGFKSYGYFFNNRITEAPGPVRQYFPSMDLRGDGLAHLFYFYDRDGNLTEIKEYDIDATGNESLNKSERFVYVKD